MANTVATIEDTIWIASFDIGKKNFAFCIEEITPAQFDTIQNIPPKSARYLRDGTCTLEWASVIEQVVKMGRIILLKNTDLTNDCTTLKMLEPQHFVNMTATLDRYKEYWNRCSVVLIEQQMGFGKERNIMALKLGQHCYSYFSFQYAGFKELVEFPAYNKTRILGAKKKITKYQRKTWAIQKALEILTLRKDRDTLDTIMTCRKKDDMSDVIVQLQAYKAMMYL